MLQTMRVHPSTTTGIQTMARNIDSPSTTSRISSEMPLIASTERSTGDLSVSLVEGPDDQQQRYIALQAQCDQLRQWLAAEIHARKSDQAAARQSLERAQDLNAALFRVRQQLRVTEMDAQESEGRCVDLEVTIRELGERREADLHALGVIASMRQAQELEIERVRAHSMEVSRLLAGVLSSRSWSMTRPLRRLAELARGRSWREPQVPAPSAAWTATDSPTQPPEGVAKPSEGTSGPAVG